MLYATHCLDTVPISFPESELPLSPLPVPLDNCKGNADSGNEIARVTSMTTRTRDQQRKAELRWEGEYN